MLANAGAAIHMLGKDLGHFVDKVEHSGKVSFGELVEGSMPEHLKPKVKKDDAPS